MNIIIVEDHHHIAEDRVRLSGRYFDHITKVLKSQIGDRLSVGRLNGFMGKAQLHDIGRDWVELALLELTAPPPPTLPISLILGLPRPRMLQRTLQTIATMGVQHLHLIQSSRVEKSFWQTPLLQPQTVHEQLIIGLEQGKATQLPTVEYHPRFRPFIEDYALAQEATATKLIAHPGPYPAAQPVTGTPTILAIGPEGGFIPREVELFRNRGFEPIQLGERILRVETAIPVLLGKLF